MKKGDFWFNHQVHNCRKPTPASRRCSLTLQKVSVGELLDRNKWTRCPFHYWLEMELLPLHPDLRLSDWVKSFQQLCERCYCLHMLMRTEKNQFLKLLETKQRSHHACLTKAYGEAAMKPKHHFSLHIPVQFEKMQVCMDTKTCERKHRALKEEVESTMQNFAEIWKSTHFQIADNASVGDESEANHFLADLPCCTRVQKWLLECANPPVTWRFPTSQRHAFDQLRLAVGRIFARCDPRRYTDFSFTSDVPVREEKNNRNLCLVCHLNDPKDSLADKFVCDTSALASSIELLVDDLVISSMLDEKK